MFPNLQSSRDISPVKIVQFYLCIRDRFSQVLTQIIFPVGTISQHTFILLLAFKEYSVIICRVNVIINDNINNKWIQLYD